MSSPGRALALACLAVLAVSFAPDYRPSRLAARLDPPRDRSFASDPRFRKFLEGIADTTPPTATIAILTPDSSADLYVELAAYELAPRRVVGEERSGDAAYLAVYGPAASSAVPDRARILPGGFLLLR